MRRSEAMLLAMLLCLKAVNTLRRQPGSSACRVAHDRAVLCLPPPLLPAGPAPQAAPRWRACAAWLRRPPRWWRPTACTVPSTCCTKTPGSSSLLLAPRLVQLALILPAQCNHLISSCSRCARAEHCCLRLRLARWPIMRAAGCRARCLSAPVRLLDSDWGCSETPDEKRHSAAWRVASLLL